MTPSAAQRKAAATQRSVQASRGQNLQHSNLQPPRAYQMPGTPRPLTPQQSAPARPQGQMFTAAQKERIEAHAQQMYNKATPDVLRVARQWVHTSGKIPRDVIDETNSTGEDTTIFYFKYEARAQFIKAHEQTVQRQRHEASRKQIQLMQQQAAGLSAPAVVLWLQQNNLPHKEVLAELQKRQRAKQMAIASGTGPQPGGQMSSMYSAGDNSMNGQYTSPPQGQITLPGYDNLTEPAMPASQQNPQHGRQTPQQRGRGKQAGQSQQMTPAQQNPMTPQQQQYIAQTPQQQSAFVQQQQQYLMSVADQQQSPQHQQQPMSYTEKQRQEMDMARKIALKVSYGPRPRSSQSSSMAPSAPQETFEYEPPSQEGQSQQMGVPKYQQGQREFIQHAGGLNIANGQLQNGHQASMNSRPFASAAGEGFEFEFNGADGEADSHRRPGQQQQMSGVRQQEQGQVTPTQQAGTPSAVTNIRTPSPQSRTTAQDSIISMSVHVPSTITYPDPTTLTFPDPTTLTYPDPETFLQPKYDLAKFSTAPCITIDKNTETPCVHNLPWEPLQIDYDAIPADQREGYRALEKEHNACVQSKKSVQAQHIQAEPAVQAEPVRAEPVLAQPVQGQYGESEVPIQINWNYVAAVQKAKDEAYSKRHNAGFQRVKPAKAPVSTAPKKAQVQTPPQVQVIQVPDQDQGSSTSKDAAIEKLVQESSAEALNDDNMDIEDDGAEGVRGEFETIEEFEARRGKELEDLFEDMEGDGGDVEMGNTALISAESSMTGPVQIESQAKSQADETREQQEAALANASQANAQAQVQTTANASPQAATTTFEAPPTSKAATTSKAASTSEAATTSEDTTTATSTTTSNNNTTTATAPTPTTTTAPPAPAPAPPMLASRLCQHLGLPLNTPLSALTPAQRAYLTDHVTLGHRLILLLGLPVNTRLASLTPVQRAYVDEHAPGAIQKLITEPRAQNTTGNATGNTAGSALTPAQAQRTFMQGNAPGNALEQVAENTAGNTGNTAGQVIPLSALTPAQKAYMQEHASLNHRLCLHRICLLLGLPHTTLLASLTPVQRAYVDEHASEAFEKVITEQRAQNTTVNAAGQVTEPTGLMAINEATRVPFWHENFVPPYGMTMEEYMNWYLRQNYGNGRHS